MIFSIAIAVFAVFAVFAVAAFDDVFVEAGTVVRGCGGVEKLLGTEGIVLLGTAAAPTPPPPPRAAPADGAAFSAIFFFRAMIFCVSGPRGVGGNVGV